MKTTSEMKLERRMPAKATLACKECGAEFEEAPARCICGAYGSMVLVDKKGVPMNKKTTEKETKLLALRLPLQVYDRLKKKAEQDC